MIQLVKSFIKRLMPSRLFIKRQYFWAFKKKLNLNKPTTFNEKIQYLKLYDRNPLYTVLSDKLKAKEFVADLIGKEYVIPTLGVWTKASEIDFQALPKRFVLKCNHDSGSTIVCKDSSMFDFDDARKRLNQCVKSNFYYYGREWSYKNIKRRIFAEKYMADNSEGAITDYKFYCFDGRVDCVMVCLDRQTGDTKFYFFDKKWNLKRINNRGKNAPTGFTVEKPALMDKMFQIAEKLSKGIPFVRIDLYQCDNHIYFGEYTFYPHSGTDTNYLPETELYFGNMINLDKVYSKRRKE